jgi:hypothetical protein
MCFGPLIVVAIKAYKGHVDGLDIMHSNIDIMGSSASTDDHTGMERHPLI